MSTSLFMLFILNGIIFTILVTISINNMCVFKKIEWLDIFSLIVYILAATLFWSMAFGVLQIKGTF